jgi:segregation and condensation protein B
MSRKPSKKSKSENTESENDIPDSDDSEDVELGSGEREDLESEDSEEDDEFDEYDDEEEEFSLDQLSQAYAEVLKSREPAGETEESEPKDQSSAEKETELEDTTPEVDDNAGCSISPESIIESILFVGTPKDVKLNSRKVAAVLRDVSPKEVTKTVRELNKKYEKENAAYRIESDGGVFKMILDPALLDFQQDFFGRNRQVRLAQSAIDVMAIVAYNQPVTREQVDKIRAKPSGGVLNQLVKRQLLYIEPGEENSKIKYYATTDRFLDLFQLEEIADLPQSHDVSDIAELAD